MELLAPAGSPESLEAAVSAGADAVYFGSHIFSNARMNAAGFTKEELQRAIYDCRVRGVKSHITVNTILSDREMEQLYRYAVFLYQSGANAVIVQDLGAVSFLRQAIPELPIHASTQMGICNPEGVRFAASLGCERAVLARELSKEDLLHISSSAPIELEVFVHGALCACYSGYCLMSSFIGRRSGNRGKCAQPCRLPYQIAKEAPSDKLSMKDLMLLDYLEELQQMRISSLKIEGRMKSPDYVRTVVEIYRRALDHQPITQEDRERLMSAFQRGGYTDGYYTKQKPRSMFAYQKPKPTQATPKQRTVLTARKVEVTLTANFSLEHPMELTIEDREGNQVSVSGTTLAVPAKNRPLQRKDLEERLCRLGDTPFQAKDVHIHLEEGILLPFSEINHVRREACEQLQQVRTFVPPLTEKGQLLKLFCEPVISSAVSFTASVTTAEQLKEVIQHPEIVRIYLPYSLARVTPYQERFVVVLPPNYHPGNQLLLDSLRAKGYHSFSATNVGDLEVAEYVDYPIWTMNSTTLQFLSGVGVKGVCLSPELNLAQIRQLKTDIPCEVLIYGHLPLMFSKHCFVKTARGHCDSSCSLMDRTGAKFPCICDPEIGFHSMLNGVPLYMGDRIADFSGSCVQNLRMLFTIESGEECRRVMQNLFSSKEPEGNFTRGHFYRGV